ncbi:flagellar hook-associated protein FlgK [Massilia varians]|uniref:Flagellar hook-associated protein 1 n=1 Tax=Massilia varians TaxID=457921 RepID=A0ABN6TJ11_9BURK|nr:flagellar hook-associated protein FlgK [Massilia varians]BDT60588.1 flagellar hook-associated protein FlgK [Massilia varians]
MSLLSIGKSGLFAAQAGLTTTGHNIANANVAGYSRQLVQQATAPMLDMGYGFMGTGTQISQIKRYSDEFLNSQVRTAQAGASALDAYHAQIKQLDNMLADQSAGLSPALQGFFSGVQDVVSGHASVPSRQAMLSGAQALATRFQALDARFSEIREGVNNTIASNVTAINAYASEIAELNRQISSFASAERSAPNDLLDKRSQLVLELNTHVKASVTPGDNNSLTVSIGNGQPLVVGQRTFQLAAIMSPYDQSRLEVGYVLGASVSPLGDNALSGGELGGILEFRNKTLDPAQSALGKVAIGMAVEFNAQHRLGLDQNGDRGGDFFTVAKAWTGAHERNASTSDTKVEAIVREPSKLVDSDYEVRFNGTGYDVTRLSDKTPIISNYVPNGGPPPSGDGIEFTITGTAATAGDRYLVRPTIAGAANFNVAIQHESLIAAAAPVATFADVNNGGTAKISAGTVGPAFLSGPPVLPVTLRYDGVTGNLNGFPANMQVDVVDRNGKAKPSYLPPVAGVAFVEGDTYTVGGVSFSLSGKPANGDLFEIRGNGGGIGDVRNAGLLGDLQTKNIFSGGAATLQGSYAQLVSTIGNKTREVQVTGQASNALLAQTQTTMQDVSGVNLDEEATNLIKYQQAYQAAGKIMQIAGTIFDTLLSIGR